jgi:hypothetical protein
MHVEILSVFYQHNCFIFHSPRITFPNGYCSTIDHGTIKQWLSLPIVTSNIRALDITRNVPRISSIRIWYVTYNLRRKSGGAITADTQWREPHGYVGKCARKSLWQTVLQNEQHNLELLISRSGATVASVAVTMAHEALIRCWTPAKCKSCVPRLPQAQDDFVFRIQHWSDDWISIQR